MRRPANETKRVEALEDLELMYTPAEERFDRITRIACQLLQAPIGLFSLVHRDAVWFKSSQGLITPEVDRSIAFCSHTLLGNSTLALEDTTRDERFAYNPLVTDRPHIMSYVGCPVRGPRGYKIGTLAVCDSKPRVFSPHEKQSLQDLACWVESELRNLTLGQNQKDLTRRLNSARRKTLVDALTQAWNRKGIDRILAQEVRRSCREKAGFAVLMMDLDHFKVVNDTYGHPVGDTVLRRSAYRIRKSIRAYDALGRYGGEEFILVAPRCSMEEALRIGEKIRANIGATPYEHEELQVPVTISIGAAIFNCTEGDDILQVVQRADRALYKAKEGGRNRVEKAEF